MSPDTPSVRSGFWSALASVFASGSTLVCCALPALMVALGSGAALASLVSAVPQLVWVSEHKVLVFGLAALMLLLAGALQWRARRAPCPADPMLAAACARTRRVSAMIYAISVGIYLVGMWFAFLAV